MRESWTDDRLDDLARRVETGFAQLHADNGELRNAIERIAAESRTEARALRSEMRDLRDDLKADLAVEREERRAETKYVLAQIATLNNRLVGGLIAILATIVGLKLY